MDIPSAKEAAKKAVELLVELIPEARYAALEGIELSDDGKLWKVLVGYVRNGDVPVTALSAITNPQLPRTYKVIELDRATLELVRMEPYRDSDHA